MDVILPAWNDPDLTWRCVQSLLAGSSGWERVRIILVNDACPQVETELIGLWLERAGHTYVRLAENVGCHGAWNAGFERVDSDLVLFINNDVAVAPQCMSRLIHWRYQSGADYMAATEYPSRLLSYGLAMPWLAQEHDAVKLDEAVRNGYFNSCFLVRRSVFAKTGLFNAGFKIEYGDMDWLHRFWDAGFQSMICTKAFAYHDQSASRRRNRGVELDVTQSMVDQALFHLIWGDRPDVLAKHPWETAEQKRAGREHFWQGLP